MCLPGYYQSTNGLIVNNALVTYIYVLNLKPQNCEMCIY